MIFLCLAGYILIGYLFAFFMAWKTKTSPSDRDMGGAIAACFFIWPIMMVLCFVFFLFDTMDWVAKR